VPTQQPRSGILVVGSINTDLVIRGPHLPAAGETVTGGEFYRALGGKGANQAVAAARAALSPVTFVGAVGDDELGNAAFAHLRSENLICDYIKTVPGEPSGVALILVDEAGQNLISVAAGANGQLTPRDLDNVPDAVFTAASIFLTSLETPLETVKHGLQRARRARLMTLLNPAPASRSIVDAGVLSLVDVLTPNAGEASLLTSDTRRSGEHDDKSALDSARKLQSLGCRQVIVTLGSEGCLVVDARTRISGRAVRAVDATAAGDAFNGALAVGLSEGRSLVEAARWANAAAALSVMKRGAQPSLPTRPEIDAFCRVGRTE
jgi:ribokinase